MNMRARMSHVARFRVVRFPDVTNRVHRVRDIVLIVVVVGIVVVVVVDANRGDRLSSNG